MVVGCHTMPCFEVGLSVELLGSKCFRCWISEFTLEIKDILLFFAFDEN